MAQTQIRGTQVEDGTIQRRDLNTTTVGQAVAAKIIQGTNITISSTGADSGTGDVTVSAPAAVSADAGNLATLGSDNLISVPPSGIWSVRLRSFNAIGNPSFEVDQWRNGTITDPTTVKAVDRWQYGRAGGTTARMSTQSVVNAGGPVLVPGTNFGISANYLRLTLTTAQVSLAAGDYLYVLQNAEGPMWRELASDVHSISILCRSSVANLTFGLSLRDPGATRSLTKLCTLGAANTTTLISLPNLPIWSSSGGFVSTPGSVGYVLAITLGAGSTFISPANDSWQNGNFIGAVGQMNFTAQAVNSTFDLCFVQHEPGAVCTALMDLPFSGPNGNLEACERYFQKTYDYAVKPGTASNTPGMATLINPVASQTLVAAINPFRRRMAKDPTVTIYNHSSGAANSMQFAGSAATVSSIGGIGETGFCQITFATAQPIGAGYLHYTADTGW